MMSSQHLEPELTVGEIIKLYLSHWRMFALFSAGLFAVGVLIYVVKIPFVASSKIVVNDSQNSALQAFSTQYFGLSKTVEESKKGSSLLSKHIEYLKTREFYELLLKKIPVRGDSPLITMEERNGYEILRSHYLKQIDQNQNRNELLMLLNRWTRVQLASEFELKVSAVTPLKSVSLFLSNTISELAAETLKQRELDELNRVESFMVQQKKAVDERLSVLSKELVLIQNKDENIMPLASREKMGDYVSDLLVRSNEIKLKIEENKKMIEYFENARNGHKDSSLYGLGGKIEALKIENNLLSSRLSQVESSIQRLKKEVKFIPFAEQRLEGLKKKSEIEFARYKELTTSLAKLEAQKISIGNRFEVLENARWENTLPQVGLLTLGLLSIVLSQFLGSLIIYFRYLWNPNVITAQASRNLVIFDDHSVDPRVIIENSKINFSLKKAELKKENEPGTRQEDVAWSVLNVGQGTDISQ